MPRASRAALARLRRRELGNWFSALQVQQAAFHSNTLLDTQFVNLIAPTTLLRFDSGAAGPTSPTAEHGRRKSHVTADGTLVPARVQDFGDPARPYAGDAARTVYDHVRGKDPAKSNSPLTSTLRVSADLCQEILRRLRETFGRGCMLHIDSGKADVIPPRLAVAMLLFGDFEGADVRMAWDWRQDAYLVLDGEASRRHVAERLVQHGIDPDATEFSRAERMAIFVLVTQEHLVVNCSRPGAVIWPDRDPPAGTSGA